MVASPATILNNYLYSIFLTPGSYSARAEENDLRLDDAQQGILLKIATIDTKNGGAAIPMYTNTNITNTY
jgi:hypothetical protein